MTLSAMLDRTRNDSFPNIPAPLTPSHDDVIAALDRIIHSTEFRASPHLAAFLRFSVEKSLAGEASFIKAYSIATSVLGRPPTFDPQADPIVRVEATRLRRALERYYLHDGADDPILIDIPRGRYVAYFSSRDHTHKVATPAHSSAEHEAHEDESRTEDDVFANARYVVSPRAYLDTVWTNLGRSERRSITVFVMAIIGAVMTWTLVPMLTDAQKPPEQALILQPITTVPHPIDDHASDSGSRQNMTGASDRAVFATLQLMPLAVKSERKDVSDVAHRLISQIALRAREFEGIPVIDPDMPPAFVPPSLHHYSLIGTVFEVRGDPTRVEISMRLVHQASREIVWTHDFAIEAKAGTTEAGLRAITHSVVISLAGLHGAIRVDDARRHLDPDQVSSSSQICLANSDIALRTDHPELITGAIACLSDLATKTQGEALIYKQLAALRLAQSHLANGQGPDLKMKSVQLAMADLETAIKLQPEDQFALTALIKLQKSQESGH